LKQRKIKEQFFGLVSFMDQIFSVYFFKEVYLVFYIKLMLTL